MRCGFRFFLPICMGLILVCAGPASAYKLIKDSTDKERDYTVLVLPYVFNSEAAGFNYGIGGGISGWPQEQAIVGGTVWKSPNGTDAIYLNLTDYQFTFAKRFFLTLHGMDASYGNMISYASSSSGASNSSSKNSYHGGHGWDQWLEGELSYVLSWGPHGDDPIHTFSTTKGTIVDGQLYDGTYDPFESGRSYLKFKPFYRKRWYREDAPSSSDVETAGVRLTWEYDNTDFWYAPSEGSKTMVRLYQGVDTGSTDSWTALELDFSSFYGLGESDWFKKQVVGFNAWAVDTLSWDERGDGSVTGESPYYMGAALGGYMHQRGYPFYRFHDKAGYNLALEYRVTPRWSPLDRYRWFKWWEVVPFAELGRVAPYFNFENVTHDLKYSVGAGVRIMILNSIIRFDAAASGEGMNGWMMVNQSF